ncbi:MAG: DNA repair protein RadC [Bacteroidaceae bacterium]|nr:DNA repair protein RadC [Bacteroidaceae bacterium]
MKINIKDLPIDERPREKMMAQGAAALSNAELLAILIGSGNSEETAVGLMQRVLQDCRGSLNSLGRMTINDLTSRYKGIGEAKAITLLAACELGSRRRKEEVVAKRKIVDSNDAYEYFAPMRDLPLEEAHLLMLRQDRSIIGEAMVSRGGIAGTAVDVRELMRHALLNRATSIVLCHNHPSGNLQPSREDDNLTRHVAEACRVMNIRLIDHIIVADQGYYSYYDKGKL